jgi:hypothetical protein
MSKPYEPPQPGNSYAQQPYEAQPQQPHPPQQAPYAGQPYAQQPYAPPIIINNNVAAAASAAAFAGGYGRRKRHSFWVHFWLFLFTAGLGNIVYAWYVSDWNKKHGV